MEVLSLLLMIVTIYRVHAVVLMPGPDTNNPGNLPVCEFNVWDHSKLYFNSRLKVLDPHFIEFSLNWNRTVINATYSSDLFLPSRWVWTFRSPTGNYPYLSWNIDHGVLSFGLLDTRTIEVPYIQLEPKIAPCSMMLGNRSTTWNIAMALTSLINGTTGPYHKYEINYFCFLLVEPGVKNTVAYTAALYLNFPISYINYNCCVVKYFYTNNSYGQNCLNEQINKWSQCVQMPYIVGLFVFLYFPIVLFQACGWFEQEEEIVSQDYKLIEYISNGNDDNEQEGAETWVYLDGKPPITLSNAFSCSSSGLSKRYPALVSRFRRLCGLLIGPLVIFCQLLMYRHGMGAGKHKIKVADLVKAGTPIGYLALLAPLEDGQKVFAPAFFGPLGLLLIYYLLGFIFIVLPTSVKQIVENGLPTNKNKKYAKKNEGVLLDSQMALPVSPLLLSTQQIVHIAMGEMTESPEPGYAKGSVVLRSSFYMLFTSQFWITVWTIQKQRFQTNATTYGCMRCLRIAIYPFMAIMCFIEILICIAYYGVPIFGFVRIMVKGATTSLLLERFRPDGCFVCFFRNPVTVLLGTALILVMFLMFAYSSCMIFIQSFSFLAEIIIFCFVAVIIYPSVSFGYLFFFVVLIYYLARLIRSFGDGYLEILSTAVERSVDMDSQVNYVTIQNDTLTVSNVRVANVSNIRINGSLLNIPQNALQIQNNTQTPKKTNKKGNLYGIPRRLFDQLVRKYRPVHVQVLKLIFHLMSIILLIVMTMSITSKVVSETSSEISDVMHVIFLVTVGALPRVLEVAMMNESKVVKKEIEERNIEETILNYWLRVTDERNI